MPLNPFDEAVDELEPPAQAPAATVNPYDAIVTEHRAEKTAQIRTTALEASTKAPDQVAEARKYADRFGLPASVVESNFPAFKQRAQVEDAARVTSGETPHLADWIAKPENAAVAHDDLENLGTLEWLVTAPQRAFAQQVNQLRYSELRFRQMNGETLSQEDRDKLSSYKRASTLGGELGAGDSWFRKGVKGLFQLEAQAIEPFKYGAVGALEMGATGAAAGAIPGSILPGAGTLAGAAAGGIAGAGYGMKAGIAYGVLKTTMQQEAVQAYDELLDMKDEHGQPIDPNVARVASLAVGGINGAVELWGLEKFLESVPGLRNLTGGFTRDAMKQALKRPTIRAAFGELAKNYGGVLTSEVAQEVAQRAVAISAEELSKVANSRGTVPGQLTPGNVDLFQQPAVKNADGSISTVDSLSVNLDGREVLLPTVTPDGRHFAGSDEERVAQAVAEFKKTGRHLGMFASPEAADTFAKQLHEDYAAGKYAGASKFRTLPQVGQELAQEGVGAVQAFAFGLLPGPTLSLAHNVARARAASRNVEFFTELGAGVTASKTFERLPQAAQDFIATATKDGPLAHVYAPLDTWASYWQSQQLDPAKVAAELTGDPAAYETAQRTGEDLVIPTAAYAAKLAGTEHNTYFANELRFAPDQMNGREAVAFTEQQQAAAAETATQPTPAEQARAALTANLERAGVPAPVADRYAAWHEAIFQQFGEKTGLDPADLQARRYTTQVSRPDLAATASGDAGTAAAPAAEGSLAVAATLPLETGGLVSEAAAETSPPAVQEAATAAIAPEAIDAAVETAIARQAEAPRTAEAIRAAANAAAQAEQAADTPNYADRRAQADARMRGVPAAPPHVDTAAAAAQTQEQLTDAEAAAAQTRSGLSNRAGEQPRADSGGTQQGASAGPGAESRRLQTPGLPALDETFDRRPLDETTARLTPAVTRELARILDELETFPFVEKTWHWLTGGPKTGNAAGGAADIIPGSAGAAVYDDVLAFSPVNLFKGKPAKVARGTRGNVIAALQKLIATGDVHNNLAEGALRVAEHRAAGVYTDLSMPWLPPSWGVEAPVAFTDALAEAIDAALAPNADLLADETAITDDAIEHAGGDTSFNIDEFDQKLFDDQAAADTLDTGELQPRLPGDVGDVRDTNIATPALEAPFSLTSPVAKPGKKNAGQTTLFQTARLTEPALQAFAADVKAAHPDLVAFDLRIDTLGEIRLETIAAVRGAAAQTGTKALEALTRFADDHGKRIVLSLGEKGYNPVAGGKTTTSPTRLRRFYQRFGFVNNTGRNKDFALSIATSMYREPTLRGDALELGRPVQQVDTPAFRAWFGDSKVVDDQGAPLVVYHGTTATFDSFDAGRGNVESDFGRGLYFSNEPADVGANYAGIGPDLEGKIERRAEQLDFQGDMDPDVARAQATAEFVQHGGLTMPVFLKMETPAILGGAGETRLELALEEDADGDVVNESGTLVEFIHALRNVVGEFDVRDRDVDAAVAALLEAGDGMTLADAIQVIRNTEGFNYATDDRGDLASHEIVRRALEEMGFDGVIDHTVDEKFGSQRRLGKSMVGMTPDTVHYIAFESAQVKSAIGNRGTFDASSNILYQSLPFYSRLTRAVEDSKQPKASGAQWKASIKNAKAGINKDEFALAQVDDLVDGTTYTKQDVLDYLQANAVVVEPVMLGSDGESSKPSAEAIDERAQAIYDEQLQAEIERIEERGDYDISDEGRVAIHHDDEAETWDVSVDGQDLGEDFDSEEAAQEAADKALEDNRENDYEVQAEQIRDAAQDRVSWSAAQRQAESELDEAVDRSGDTRYGDYVEPGGDPGSYREVFLTVPQVPGQRTGYHALTRAENDLLERRMPELWRDLTWMSGPQKDQRIEKGLEKLRAPDATRTTTMPGETTIRGDEKEVAAVIAALEKLRNEGSYDYTFKNAIGWNDGHQEYDGIDNPIVRLRLNTRTAVDGSRVLFLEEVQPPHASEQQKMPKLFTKNWREIAFKWALRHAAEQGLDAVAWTTGDQQAARYSLEKEVREITWRRMEGSPSGERAEVRGVGITTLRGQDIMFDVDVAGVVLPNSGSAQAEAWAGAPLENIVGKELAAKILGADVGTIAGEGLKIGGEGLRRLYNVDFKNVVNGLPAVKRNGGTVATVQVGDGRRVAEIDAEMDAVNQAFDALPSSDKIPAQLRDYDLKMKALQGERNRAKESIGSVPAVVLTPALREAVLGGQALFQEPQAQRRGSIRFGPDLQFNINLFERADLSTFIHESAHMFLEVMRDLDEHPKIAADLQVLREHLWFPGGDPNQAIGVEQHEQFARAWEAYAMEGKAPSIALRGVFADFRAWLIGIYHSLTALDVKLTPEVRQVFDRMLATDRAIAEAAAVGHVTPMFLTAAAAGMSATEFSLYSAAVADASRTATETLERKLLSEVQRAQTDAWHHQRDEIRDKVAADIYQKREYQALAAMRYGTQPDGSPLVEGLTTPPLKLSRESLVAEFGAARLATLPKPYVYSRTGGLSAGFVAERFGFSSGDELLAAIAQAPAMKDAIEAETTRQMQAQHGSLLLDGTLHAQAQAAIANDDTDVVLRAELRALAQLRLTAAPFVRAGAEALAGERKERAYERRWMDAEAALRVAIAEGHKQTEIDALALEVRQLRAQARGGAATIRAAVPSAALVRETARARLAATKVRDIKPAVFWSAARRGAEQAIAAAARQDFDGAIGAKTQELINTALYREAMRLQDDIAARVKRAQALSKGPARAKLGLAGATYLEQVDGILERYSFAPATAKALKRRAFLRDWVEALEAQGLPVDLPAVLLDESRRIHYSEISVEELVGVTDGLATIAHLATLKNRLLKAADARAFAVVRDGLAESIREKNAAHPIPLEFRGLQAGRAVAGWFAAHAKLATIIHALDGYVDGGPMWESFMRAINAAADTETVRKRAAGAAYGAILERYYPGRELATLNTKVFIPAINDSLSREWRLAVALNWGNQTSRDRVLADPVLHVNQAQVQAIFDTLDARDWQFVQATWDHVNTYWDEIAAKTERLTGLKPEKVEALPVTTKFGELAGGYYPLAYDGRKSAKAGQHQIATDAKLAAGAAYVRSTTKRGHLETRLQHVELPIRLELSVAFAHLEQVIHDLTHHEMLIDVTRLLRDRQVASAIMETRGDQVYKQITSALQDIAIGSTPPARGLMDKAANYMRTGTQISGMAWNLWTAFQQPIGMFNGMARVGPVWVAKGLTRWLRDSASMESTAGWIASVSPMMRERVTTATQDLSDVKQALQQPGGWFDSLVRTVSADHLTQQTILDSYLWHIGLAQRVADIPTWLGQYEKSMAAGEEEARAIALADQAVLDSQGGGQIKDLAGVQRGGPVARLFMTFYSYGNTVLNATMREAGSTNFRSPASVATFLGHLGLIYIIPAMITEALRRVVGRAGDGDDWAKYLADVGQQMLGDALNTMVLARELAGLARDGTRSYAGPAGTRVIELFYNLGKQIKQGELDEGLAKAANQAAGVLFRYPAMQVQRSVDGWVALQSGRTHNPLALVMGGPPKRKASR